MWTATTFEVLREVLAERLDEILPQGEPVTEYPESEDPIFTHVAVRSIEEQPNFYRPKDVLWLSKWANRAGIAAVVASILTNLFAFPHTRDLVLSFFRTTPAGSFFFWVLTLILFYFFILLESILLYVPLKGLSIILPVLMELEFNSRRPENKDLAGPKTD
jgi:hypothetical protein